MRVVSRAAKAKGVAHSWYCTYFNKSSGWCTTRTIGSLLTKEETYKAIVALGENPDPDAIDALIGNRSWTQVDCEECGAHSNESIGLGEDYEVGGPDVLVCRPCLRKALKLV